MVKKKGDNLDQTLLSVLFLSLYFLTLLKRKCFEADNSEPQLEMDMPPRQTPP